MKTCLLSSYTIVFQRIASMDPILQRGYAQLEDDIERDRNSGSSGATWSHSSSEARGGDSAPEDRHHLVYLAMVLCGVGFLLPYNNFITAVDYYQAKYPGSTIMFDMSLTYICMALAGVIVNNLLVEVGLPVSRQRLLHL